MTRLINLIIGFAIFSIGVAQVMAADTYVSPELAEKTALLLTEKYNPGEMESGYKVRVSEPKVYYNYDRSRKYYVIYLYFGPGQMPTWEDIQKNPGAYEREASYARSYILSLPIKGNTSTSSVGQRSPLPYCPIMRPKLTCNAGAPRIGNILGR